MTCLTYPDGEICNLVYSGNKIASISNEYVQSELTYNAQGKFANLTAKKLNPVSATVSEVAATYLTDTTKLTDLNGNEESFKFDSAKNIINHTEMDSARFKTEVSYTYETNDIGKKITTVTKADPDYTKTVVNIKQYNEIDLLVSATDDWQNISDTVKVKTETKYEYDLYGNLLSEIAVRYTDNAGTIKETKTVKKYKYNAQGRLVLTESYIEGEELISGKNFEERVYNDNGSMVKYIRWNSLDSSSKFYEESDRAENGQVISDRDETGAVSAEYEYVANSNTVNSVKYPNGSKFAYGRDPNNDRVTSVTQSTDDGEANQTDIVYEHGLPVEVKSGNTVIEYTYDGKDRKTSVSINGVEQSKFSYRDYSYDEDSDSACFGEETEELAGGTIITASKIGVLDEETGRLKTEESLKINNTVVLNKKYDAEGRLYTAVDYVTGTINYGYDAYNNLKRVQTKNDSILMNEVFTRNEYGELTGKAITGAVSHTYNYYYDTTTAARNLKYISFDNFKFYPLTDVNGRNTGKEIYNGENKIAAEYITYRKVGDHATNMPATVWFGSGNNIKDSIKYKYDSCGNICRITQNGHVVAKYTYDSLNRLIREDNKALNRTTVYTYDRNGNIVERCIYDYTNKTGEELTELDCIHSNFDYDGDRLINYNGYRFAYNSLGNPTTYRDIALTWQYGKYLTQIGSLTFAYDGLGRRISKGNITFTYDNDGRLIKQSNGLEFVYDDKGIVGVRYANNTYFYRKDAQGNIISLLNTHGAVVANYVYDAWGNHKVVDSNGNTITSGIGILNPFRYRGYYYDTETELYYLQTRYYDPEVGRFISRDSIEHADPETINGINLYAYCGNNPVMNVDPTGNAWWEFWKWDWASIGKIVLGVAVVAGLAVASVLTGGTASVIFAGATIGAGAGFLGGGISGVVSGGGLAGFANGALLGAVTGAISGAFAATGFGIGWQMGFNAVLSVGNYMATQAISGANITLGGLIVSAGLGAFVGFFGGHGWTSAAMGGKSLILDVAMNMGKNFLQHTVAYLGKEFFAKFFAANVFAGILNGGYSSLSNIFNKWGDFFGF